MVPKDVGFGFFFCFIFSFLKKNSRNILCTGFWKSRTKRVARLANFGFCIFTCLSKHLCQMLLLTVCRKKRESDCDVLVQKVQPVRLFVSLCHVGLYYLFWWPQFWAIKQYSGTNYSSLLLANTIFINGQNCKFLMFFSLDQKIAELKPDIFKCTHSRL